jgi:acetoacetyl-CoA synthetase
VVVQGEKLWEPSPERANKSSMAAYMRWLNANHGLSLKTYDDLWRWSIADIETFWRSIAEYCDVKFHHPPAAVLGRRAMPGAQWFPGATLNYAEHMLRNARLGEPAMYTQSETEPLSAVSWDELIDEVKRVALAFKKLGIEKGDRVVCVLPAIRETTVCFLAAASIGAIWSLCSPDFGTQSVIDRFAQVEPKLLIIGDGYRYGGKTFDRRAEAKEIIAALPSLKNVLWLPRLDCDAECPADMGVSYRDLLATQTDIRRFQFEALPFDHPLWIVYTSGTTGLPKPIVHGHGGVTLELLKSYQLAGDCRPGEVAFFYTTTGWVMWNIVVSFMLVGIAPVFYDGHPAYPHADILWDMASKARANVFGASPTFIQMMMRAGVVPTARYDLSELRNVILGGSPVTPEVMKWFYENVKEDLWVTSQSGGTDVVSGFVGASPLLPVHAGEIQARFLGVDVCAFNDAGEEVVGQVGELVIRQPMPSMPLYFWNDKDDERYRSSYFEPWPGVWRHGDFLEVTKERGSCVISGRSDATLNRFGVRIGSAEIYRTIESMPAISDSLIVSLELPGGAFFMPLFIKLADGFELTDDLVAAIKARLSGEYSPRHVPDAIFAVDDVPYTLTGKKTEVPVKRILTGTPIEKAISVDALRAPAAIKFFEKFARHYPYQAFRKL